MGSGSTANSQHKEKQTVNEARVKLVAMDAAKDHLKLFTPGQGDRPGRPYFTS